jgi:hypothetical protein
MAIFKQWVILLILSLVAIFFKHELVWVLHGLAYCYQHVASGINHLLPQNPWLKLLVLAVVLILSTLIISAAVGGIGCLFKKHFNKWFVPAAWVTWVVLTVTIILQGT